MADLVMEILAEDELTIDLNEGHIDPYLQLEDIEVVEAPRTVDTEMSDTSENPVQNKVIKAYVDSIAGDKHYTHTQIAASNTWLVPHNLDKFPAVMIVDSGNSVVLGDIEYLTTNTLQIKFSTAFSGKAYCN